VRRPAVRWRGRRGDDDRGPRRLERQGQARTGLAAGAPELAAGVRSSGMTEREQVLEELRPVPFAIAYRMPRVSAAEDIVQEALLRVHRALEDGEQIASHLRAGAVSGA